MEASVLDRGSAPHMLTTKSTRSPTEELLDVLSRKNGHLGLSGSDVQGTGNRSNCLNSGQTSTSPSLESSNQRTLASTSDDHHGQSGSGSLTDTPLSLKTSQAPLSPTRPGTSSSSRVDTAPMLPRHTSKLGLETLHIPCTTQLVSRGCSPPALMAYGGSNLDRAIHTSSPPGIPADAANECRLIDYRGAKVAAFRANNEYLLCLPQAFEVFLKHLVGGLHTVYTKLKRLDITPIVCNVEQVRILRGLGAIQPGVNRCKLLSCKNFDSLYKDCITAR
ncbi:dachshund homolog 1-like [Limulus polyphemus]|uniref:Dachshund homolog 1-like n=1 Tax=Limulus polyphemus TaxID=6850 RepID=A0ABM1BYW0_LIMPO|nr:dachshund homolog 1-like [Limulus polyphemus]